MLYTFLLQYIILFLFFSILVTKLVQVPPTREAFGVQTKVEHREEDPFKAVEGRRSISQLSVRWQAKRPRNLESFLTLTHASLPSPTLRAWKMRFLFFPRQFLLSWTYFSLLWGNWLDWCIQGSGACVLHRVRQVATLRGTFWEDRFVIFVLLFFFTRFNPHLNACIEPLSVISL